MKKLIALVTIFVAVILASMAAVWLYCEKSLTEVRSQQEFTDVYNSLYVFVSDDDSVQTESLFDAAVRAGKETGVKVERSSMLTYPEFTMQEKMTIAVAEKADGIILCSRNSGDIASLVPYAEAAKIPVVTVLSDDSETSRISFIGLNSYEVGAAYGEQILAALKKDKNRILVLMNTDTETVQSSLIYSTMLQVIERGKTPGVSSRISVQSVNSAGAFEAEEAIRDIFVKSEETPDILVCLDAVTTECAIQAATDYNRVGEVSIIGYYASKETLDAIPKGIIQATLAVDAEKIGTMACEALNEYLELGYVSNYFPADFQMVTAENVKRYAG